MRDHTRLHVPDHPLIRHKVSQFRDKETGAKRFRELAEEITSLIAYEATRDLRGVRVDVETPLERTQDERVDEGAVVVVPILRAGLGMVPGVLRLLPEAVVGHLGFYRDETTLEPVRYYGKLPPNLEWSTVLIVDPMLGTGGTASAAVSELAESGAVDIRVLCLVTAPEGIERVLNDNSEVRIVAASVDRCLGPAGYILPGLGDAGDRLFGT